VAARRFVLPLGHSLILPASVTDDDANVTVMNGDVMVSCEDSSDCDVSLSVRPIADGGGSSPCAQRRKRLCKLRDSLKCRDGVDIDRSNADADNIYADNLPEVCVCMQLALLEQLSTQCLTILYQYK